MSFGHLRGTPRVVLAGVLIAAIAIVDWRVDPPISFGFLYLAPILLVGTAWGRGPILATAFLCTFLADRFNPYAFRWAISLPEDILVFSALAGTGLTFERRSADGSQTTLLQ